MIRLTEERLTATMPHMAMQWIRGHRTIGPGTAVEVLSGPYAGRSGVVTRFEAGALDVFIDDCCQATLQTSEVRRTRRRSLQDVVRQARESDPIAEEGRATGEIRDWVDSMGPR